jgi:hypothetical protein
VRIRTARKTSVKHLTPLEIYKQRENEMHQDSMFLVQLAEG